jgi:hypothetical protein
VPVSKQVFHQRAIGSGHASMMDAKAVWQQLTQV